MKTCSTRTERPDSDSHLSDMIKTSPVPTRPSATVVVFRDGPSGPELLLVRRRAGDAFGDSYAFPGGVVDPDETAAHAFCSGLTPDEADRVLQVDHGGLDYYSAAIRELFEETGILLAQDADGNWAADGSQFGELRWKVDKGKLPWSEFLQRQGLCMASDALYYFAWWETPYDQPKRWTTRFFVAELPPGQEASHDGTEVTDSRWLTAPDALALGQAGELPMPLPTVRNLRVLSRFRSDAELLRWVRQQQHSDIRKIRPVPITRDGRTKYVIPGDPDYPEPEQQ